MMPATDCALVFAAKTARTFVYRFLGIVLLYATFKDVPLRSD